MQKNNHLFEKLRFTFAVLPLFLLLCLSCDNAPKKVDHLKLKIIQTTDVHGAIFAYDLKNQKDRQGSLSRVYNYVKRERAKQDQVVLLLDNGDILQGTPEVYFSNFVETDTTHILSEVMNLMGYDAATVGNHDIEAGHPVYDKIRKEFDFPWMAANAIDTKTGQPYFDPYTVIERKGLKIAVLGLITPGIPNWLPEKMFEGMHFEDMIESAKKWVKVINEKEQPDILIGLFHSGIDPTYGGADPNAAKNENASMLVAKQVAGFDVIFAGHDHREHSSVVENIEGRKVLVLNPQSYAQKLGIADIEFKLNPKTDRYTKQIKGHIDTLYAEQPDSAFVFAFAPFQKKVAQYVDKPIGTFESEVRAIDSFFGPSAFIDLIHQAQLELTGAEISLVSPLTMNTTIRKGKVFVRDMFNLYKYENFLYTMALTGAEVEAVLNYAYDVWVKQMKSDSDYMINFLQDENGKLVRSQYSGGYSLTEPFFNFDSGAGIIYTVDLRKPEGQKVEIRSMADDSKFDTEKIYK
ncbi:MAG: bifunctional metallophosphatase/5'-nucleotidase, partial [Okeania sp. SIO3C4]|nr:bifunctional metallophosphatase/5'-nucleotidase [Okeania sp. SIO3C4]